MATCGIANCGKIRARGYTLCPEHLPPKSTPTTTEREMESIITEALEHEDEECGTTSPVKRISTFSDCGILTRNKGLVVTMEDGTEFQVTIVQSR